MHNAKVMSYDDDYDDDDDNQHQYDHYDHHNDHHDHLFFDQMAAKDKEIEDLKYRVVEVRRQNPTDIGRTNSSIVEFPKCHECHFQQQVG